MCDLCLMSPCHPSCPNAPEPPTVYVCESCGEPIVVGDEFYEFGDKHYHEDCFEDIVLDLAIEHLGVTKGTAEEEWEDDEGWWEDRY